MADIATPTTARKTEDFTPTQRELVKKSLGIGDNPYHSEKTYILFDAVSGNNNLHIDTGGSSTYSILMGDGSPVIDYNDTGGLKVLNYTTAGRYLITINGAFNGININGASAGDKNKYIKIVGGSNYPTTIAANSFHSCFNLKSAIFESVTTVGDSAFYQNLKLKEIEFLNVTTIGDASFFGCNSLINIEFLSVTTLGNFSFESCLNLIRIYFPLLTTTSNACFQGCENLHIAILPVFINVGPSCFSQCRRLVIYKCDYNAALSVGVNAFLEVKLSDLYIRGANSTQAAAEEAKFTTGAMAKLNGYRLLY